MSKKQQTLPSTLTSYDEFIDQIDTLQQLSNRRSYKIQVVLDPKTTIRDLVTNPSHHLLENQSTHTTDQLSQSPKKTKTLSTLLSYRGNKLSNLFLTPKIANQPKDDPSISVLLSVSSTLSTPYEQSSMRSGLSQISKITIYALYQLEQTFVDQVKSKLNQNRIPLQLYFPSIRDALDNTLLTGYPTVFFTNETEDLSSTGIPAVYSIRYGVEFPYSSDDGNKNILKMQHRSMLRNIYEAQSYYEEN